jgi:hypothetical protein
MVRVFYFSLSGAMLHNLHHADFRKEQPVIEQIEARLFEREAVVAPITFVAWKAWQFFARLYPAKEGFECRSTRSCAF